MIKKVSVIGAGTMGNGIAHVFAQYGFEGLRAMKEVIEMAQENDFLVILDAKRGDIGKTSEAYAKEMFEMWEADAITVSPYLGRDSVEPFLKYCEEGKGVYVQGIQPRLPGYRERSRRLFKDIV